jgi:hypothetical protein
MIGGKGKSVGCGEWSESGPHSRGGDPVARRIRWIRMQYRRSGIKKHFVMEFMEVMTLEIHNESVPLGLHKPGPGQQCGEIKMFRVVGG